MGQLDLVIFLEKLHNHSCLQHNSKPLLTLCKEICDSVKHGMKSSLEELQQSTKFNIGLYSTCDESQTSSINHIGIIEDFDDSCVPQDMTCIDCDDKVCPLMKEHVVWFTEVCNPNHFAHFPTYNIMILMVIPNTGFCDQEFDSRSKGSSLPDSTVIFI